MFRFLSFLICISLFAGCKKSVRSKNTKNKNSIKVIDEAYKQQLNDYLVELPELPLGYTLFYPTTSSVQGFLIEYRLQSIGFSIQLDRLQAQVIEEMEALGWYLRHITDFNEGIVLVFEKPSKKICIITINKSTKAVMFNCPQMQK